MPRIEIEHLEVTEDGSERSSETFDRMAFAERALALVRPPKTLVAVGEGTQRIHLSSGRRWARDPDARWAVLLVPRDASRAAIARAVLALHRGPGRAWALDVLMGELFGVKATPYRRAAERG